MKALRHARSAPDADAEMVRVFEAARPRLRGLAYRMVGIMADADDVVQEAWVRWSRTAHADIRVPEP